MNKKIKVSILVPIYNVEKYLSECLESLVNQTLKEIEIICINDGSTDDSLEIVKNFSKNDSRIVIIDKQNSGYGDSMNQGLKKAKGEYVGILESDDFIEPEAFEDLYILASADNAEVARCNYFHFKEGKNTKLVAIKPEEVGRVINPAEERSIFYQAPAIWSAIYRKDFLIKNKINFLPTPGASYQDTGFNFKVWASAHKVVFSNNAYLHYRLDNEASSVNNPGKVMNVSIEYEEIEKFLQKNNLLKKFGGTMEFAKFGAYYWNIERLTWKLAKDFLLVIKKEYIDAEKKNLLHKEFFDPKKWKMLHLIMNTPITLSLIIIRSLSFMRRAKKTISSIHKKLRPSYRKQLTIMEKLNLMTERMNIISRHVELLEQQLDKERKKND